MKRFLLLVSVLLASTAIGGCATAKRKVPEQQELERSIRKTSNPDAVKGCAFIMNLRPDGLHSTAEAQAASLVIPKKGVFWVVFEGSNNYGLYSCKTPPNEREEEAPTPNAAETGAKAGASAPVEAKAATAPSESKAQPFVRDLPEATIKTSEQPGKSASKTRVTNNTEAVKGCKFLASFVEYQKVSHLQEDVAKTGGNLCYIVASNRDGDVIGESYLCPEEVKP